jgi:hypothetical protein
MWVSGEKVSIKLIIVKMVQALKGSGRWKRAFTQFQGTDGPTALRDH